MKPGTKFLLGLGVIAAILWMWAILTPSPPASSRPDLTPTRRSLQLSVGRGLLGFTLVNREAHPITDCEVSLTDEHGVEWSASGHRRIEPLASAEVPYETLMALGQPLQPFMARDRAVAIRCRVVNEDRIAEATFR